MTVLSRDALAALPRIVAVDFDGTLVEDRFPGIGPELPGALAALRHFQAQGGKVVLWTSRGGKYLGEALQFLVQRHFVPDAVNSNIAGLPFPTSNKVFAHLYIDDRAFGWTPDWVQIGHAMQAVIDAQARERTG